MKDQDFLRGIKIIDKYDPTIQENLLEAQYDLLIVNRKNHSIDQLWMGSFMKSYPSMTPSEKKEMEK